MSLFGKKSFKSLDALKGKKAAEITEQEIVAVNDELEAEGFDNVVVISLSQLEEANTSADAITAGLTAINSALGLTGAKAHTTIAEAVAAIVADRDAEFDRAEAYGDQPGEKPTNPKTKANAEGTNTQTRELQSWEKKAAKIDARTKKTDK